MHRAISLLFVLANATLLAGPPAAALSGCGGCYNRDKIVDLTTTPASSCLALSVDGPGACTGGYAIVVANACDQPLAITGGPMIGIGPTPLDGEAFCPPGTEPCAIHGTLGTTPVTISWAVQVGYAN